jgi:hypothetical protein
MGMSGDGLRLLLGSIGMLLLALSFHRHVRFRLPLRAGYSSDSSSIFALSIMSRSTTRYSF